MSLEWGHIGFLSLLNFNAEFITAQRSIDSNVGIRPPTSPSQQFRWATVLSWICSQLIPSALPFLFPGLSWRILSMTSPKETHHCQYHSTFLETTLVPGMLYPSVLSQEAWVKLHALQSWEDWSLPWIDLTLSCGPWCDIVQVQSHRLSQECCSCNCFKFIYRNNLCNETRHVLFAFPISMNIHLFE